MNHQRSYIKGLNAALAKARKHDKHCTCDACVDREAQRFIHIIHVVPNRKVLCAIS